MMIKLFQIQLAIFFKTYRISDILRAANAYKKKGIAVTSIFTYLLSLIFSQRSIYMNMLMGKNSSGFTKDTVYRFLKSFHINWLRFTSLLCARVVSESIEKLTDASRVNVFIVDDSMFERSRSKKVELLSNIYDHAKSSYKYGFRMLTLGWSDGNTFLPVNSCLLSTENKKNRVNEAMPMDKRTAGFKRRQLAQTKAPQVMLELLKTAKTVEIPTSHVLFDTWFCSPSSIFAVKKLGYDVVAMTKKVFENPLSL
ncbi:MAG: transposase family protein [Firmicutes bacterium]|nr:transposase family protein [Bacillota bacterium]